MQKVVIKVLFDNIALISTTDDEFVDAVVAIGLEDVPKNWLASNLYHRLWL